MDVFEAALNILFRLDFSTETQQVLKWHYSVKPLCLLGFAVEDEVARLCFSFHHMGGRG